FCWTAIGIPLRGSYQVIYGGRVYCSRPRMVSGSRSCTRTCRGSPASNAALDSVGFLIALSLSVVAEASSALADGSRTVLPGRWCALPAPWVLPRGESQASFSTTAGVALGG